MRDEKFTDNQINHSLRTWLEYGEQSYAPNKRDGEPGHHGVFSGDGWDARVLRYLLEQREGNQKEQTLCLKSKA